MACCTVEKLNLIPAWNSALMIHCWYDGSQDAWFTKPVEDPIMLILTLLNNPWRTM